MRVEESEELPRILSLIVEDAPAAVLGGSSGMDQTPVDCICSPLLCRELCCADDLLAMRDISMDESEELPRILSPIAEDAPAAVLGGASALDQTPVDRDLLIIAIEAASLNLARLKVSACGHHEPGLEQLMWSFGAWTAEELLRMPLPFPLLQYSSACGILCRRSCLSWAQTCHRSRRGGIAGACAPPGSAHSMSSAW